MYVAEHALRLIGYRLPHVDVITRLRGKVYANTLELNTWVFPDFSRLVEARPGFFLAMDPETCPRDRAI